MRSEQHVRFRDRPRARVQHLHVHLWCREALERVADGLDAALNIGLEHDVQLLHLAGADLAEQGVERDGALLAEGVGLAQAARNAGLRARVLLAGDDDDAVARGRHFLQPHDLDRRRGPRAVEPLAAVVEHRLHFAVGLADDDGVARAQRARLDEDGGHGAPAGVELGLDDDADGVAAGVRLQLHHFGRHEHRVEQRFEAVARLRGDEDGLHIAAVVLDDDAVLGELLLHAVGVGVGHVDLVDGDDDRHAGGADVVDRLRGLRHDAVVGGDDEDGDVGDLGAAGTHRREGFVARRVDEGDELAAHVDLVRADVLGDAAGFARGDVRAADRIEEACLAVVDVAEHGDNGRPGRGGRLIDEAGARRDRRLLFVFARLCGVEPEVGGDDGSRLEVDDLVDAGHDAVLHQFLDDFDRRDGEDVAQFLHGERARNLDAGLGGFGLGFGGRCSCGGRRCGGHLAIPRLSASVARWGSGGRL